MAKTGKKIITRKGGSLYYKSWTVLSDRWICMRRAKRARSEQPASAASSVVFEVEWSEVFQVWQNIERSSTRPKLPKFFYGLGIIAPLRHRRLKGDCGRKSRQNFAF